jgi:hypothetical protein
MGMALTGNNGDNETNIGASNSLSFSLFDELNNEIPIKNLDKPIEFWIAKDTSQSIQPYQYVNAINSSENQNNSSKHQGTQLKSGFIVSGFKLTGQNVSLSVQLMPEIIKSSIGYMVLLKFGDNPIFNLSNTNYYDIMSIFCPQTDLVQNNNESFYLVFANMSRVNSFKVFFYRIKPSISNYFDFSFIYLGLCWFINY